MKLTLMHNPKAGNGAFNTKDLLALLKRAGHKVAYQSTKEKHLARALDNPGDLVLIAGGDGTIRNIALRLVGRHVPIALLPLGTANNIARALDLQLNPLEMIQALPTARQVPLDVGMATGPWGKRMFLEGAGLGLFPRMISTRAWHKKNGVPDAIDKCQGLDGGRHLLWHVLSKLRGHDFQLRLRGKTVSGTTLLLEVMNIPSIGPVLKIAPNADPGDGLLDVVLVRGEERPRLERYLRASVERQYKRPMLRVRRARKITLLSAATEFHFDDECWPDVPSKKAPAKSKRRLSEITFEILPGALTVLLPDPASRH
jgi:diacylglycerol kinase (ATP)